MQSGPGACQAPSTARVGQRIFLSKTEFFLGHVDAGIVQQEGRTLLSPPPPVLPKRSTPLSHTYYAHHATYPEKRRDDSAPPLSPPTPASVFGPTPPLLPSTRCRCTRHTNFTRARNTHNTHSASHTHTPSEKTHQSSSLPLATRTPTQICPMPMPLTNKAKKHTVGTAHTHKQMLSPPPSNPPTSPSVTRPVPHARGGSRGAEGKTPPFFRRRPPIFPHPPFLIYSRSSSFLPPSL
jgi:hypothetical protein